jgi:acyl-coenzyme A thioesterase PaaI-like protein
VTDEAAFGAVSAVVAAGDGRYRGDVHPDWTIAGKPNGGYLLAMLGRAAAEETPHVHVIAASAHYLAPPEPGPVEIATDVLRVGRGASQVRARLLQAGQACIESLVTVSTLSADTKPYWSAAAPEPGTARFEDSFRLPPVSPTGLAVTIMGVVDCRIEPSSLGFARGEPTGRGELRGWLALPDGEPFDATSLIYAVDSFPPATLDVEPTGWVPTLELTAYVRALPAPGPVRVLHQAHLVDDQRVDETCWVWDVTGRMVAHGTQLAGIRLG